MFNRSKLESLGDVSVTRIGDTLSYGFPQTVYGLELGFVAFVLRAQSFIEVKSNTLSPGKVSM